MNIIIGPGYKDLCIVYYCAYLSRRAGCWCRQSCELCAEINCLMGSSGEQLAVYRALNWSYGNIFTADSSTSSFQVEDWPNLLGTGP